MGETTEAPPLEEIDSPEHRDLVERTMILSVKPGANYDALTRFIERNRYGRVGEISKSNGKQINPEVDGHIVICCTPQEVESLMRSYERNGHTPLRYIKSIDELQDSDEEWF